MTEQRKYRRSPSSLQVDLIYQGRCHPGSLGNISLSGALVQLEEHTAIGPGQLCLLRVRIGENPPDTLEICSEAVHCTPAMAGIKFVDCDEQSTGRLSLLIEKIKEKPQKLEEDLARIREYLTDYRG